MVGERERDPRETLRMDDLWETSGEPPVCSKKMVCVEPYEQFEGHCRGSCKPHVKFVLFHALILDSEPQVRFGPIIYFVSRSHSYLEFAFGLLQETHHLTSVPYTQSLVPRTQPTPHTHTSWPLV